VAPVIADAYGASLLPIAGNAISDLVDAGKLLDVDVNRLPDFSNSKCCTGALGSRFRNRPRPRWFRVLATVEKGAASSLTMWAGAAADGVAPGLAGGAVHRASAAECGEHWIDPSGRRHHLSGGGPATF